MRAKDEATVDEPQEPGDMPKKPWLQLRAGYAAARFSAVLFSTPLGSASSARRSFSRSEARAVLTWSDAPYRTMAAGRIFHSGGLTRADALRSAAWRTFAGTSYGTCSAVAWSSARPSLDKTDAGSALARRACKC
jgi:hypothetical protein